MEVTRIFDLLGQDKEQQANSEYCDKGVALAHKVNGEWIKYSIEEYIENVNNVSYALLSLGIEPGDKVGIVSGNRPEWNFLDMGVMQIGAVPVPIYPTISQEDYRYILNHAEVKLLFIEGKELRKKIEPILPECTSIKEIFTFVNQNSGYRYFQQLVDLGKENPQPEKVEALKATVKPNDLATIIYTSGTTGNPKGVMISFGNIYSQLRDFEYMFK
ncbi:MAG: AMP-binding protein, partial [Bacteroidales bacterium]|nr:AMP-binding protein [Bacteroidales bacterium]